MEGGFLRTCLALAGALILAPVPLPASQGPGPDEASSPLGMRVLDLEGRLHVLGEHPLSRGVCVVFLGIDCPIAKESLPELGRLAELASSLSIDFFGALSDPFAAPDEARRLWGSARPPFPLLYDSNGLLAARLRPTATPEAFLFDSRGGLVYRGRIDDRGRYRIGANVPQRRDLCDALESLGHGRPIRVPRTGAIGCAYEGWPGVEARDLSWARNVAPILDAHCIDCHREDGCAPFSLERYEDAARRSKMIGRVAAERTMPRWHARAGFGALRGERVLDPDEIGVLELWSRSGARRGDEAAALRRDLAAERELGPPDSTLDAPTPIVVPADGPDLAREVTLPGAREGSRYVRAVDFRFSDPRLVRSATLFALDRDESRQETAARAIATWWPGRVVEALPAGIGHALPGASSLSLWLHVHPCGVETELRASVALWFAAEPIEQVVVLHAIRPTSDARTPGAHAGYGLRFEQRLGRAARVLALHPHLDRTGKQLKVVARLPGLPEVPLAWIHRWDAFWPERYALREPLELPDEAMIEIDASFGDPASLPGGQLIIPELRTGSPGELSAILYLELAVDASSATTASTEPVSERRQ